MCFLEGCAVQACELQCDTLWHTYVNGSTEVAELGYEPNAISGVGSHWPSGFLNHGDHELVHVGELCVCILRRVSQKRTCSQKIDRD